MNKSSQLTEFINQALKMYTHNVDIEKWHFGFVINVLYETNILTENQYEEAFELVEEYYPNHDDIEEDDTAEEARPKNDKQK